MTNKERATIHMVFPTGQRATRSALPLQRVSRSGDYEDSNQTNDLYKLRSCLSHLGGQVSESQTVHVVNGEARDDPGGDGVRCDLLQTYTPFIPVRETTCVPRRYVGKQPSGGKVMREENPRSVPHRGRDAREGVRPLERGPGYRPEHHRGTPVGLDSGLTGCGGWTILRAVTGQRARDPSLSEFDNGDLSRPSTMRVPLPPSQSSWLHRLPLKKIPGRSSLTKILDLSLIICDTIITNVTPFYFIIGYLLKYPIKELAWDFHNNNNNKITSVLATNPKSTISYSQVSGKLCRTFTSIVSEVVAGLLELEDSEYNELCILFACLVVKYTFLLRLQLGWRGLRWEGQQYALVDTEDADIRVGLCLHHYVHITTWPSFHRVNLDIHLKQDRASTIRHVCCNATAVPMNKNIPCVNNALTKFCSTPSIWMSSASATTSPSSLRKVTRMWAVGAMAYVARNLNLLGPCWLLARRPAQSPDTTGTLEGLCCSPRSRHLDLPSGEHKSRRDESSLDHGLNERVTWGHCRCNLREPLLHFQVLGLKHASKHHTMLTTKRCFDELHLVLVFVNDDLGCRILPSPCQCLLHGHVKLYHAFKLVSQPDKKQKMACLLYSQQHMRVKNYFNTLHIGMKLHGMRVEPESREEMEPYECGGVISQVVVDPFQEMIQLMMMRSWRRRRRNSLVDDLDSDIPVTQNRGLRQLHIPREHSLRCQGATPLLHSINTKLTSWRRKQCLTQPRVTLRGNLSGTTHRYEYSQGPRNSGLEVCGQYEDSELNLMTGFVDGLVCLDEHRVALVDIFQYRNYLQFDNVCGVRFNSDSVACPEHSSSVLFPSHVHRHPGGLRGTLGRHCHVVLCVGTQDLGGHHRVEPATLTRNNPPTPPTHTHRHPLSPQTHLWNCWGPSSGGGYTLRAYPEKHPPNALSPIPDESLELLGL
uniref:Uncharacterized protein n=1 Tax=Timema bartmani TaxID=61472 RepID=A0A7R9F0N5_9NEOP|nr:unnamed protein product [Timema bartmani]